jgi:hypothetical protein
MLSAAERHEPHVLGRLLQSGGLSQLASFVSPAFFEVVPARRMWRRARGLIADSKDAELVARARAERQRHVQQAGLPFRIVSDAPKRKATPSTFAQRIAELYFHQLFTGKYVLVDLRAQAFAPEGDQLLWQPSPWVVVFADDLIEPLRDVYTGFYRHDDARFRAGLAALNLSDCEDLFRKHFGEDQRHVRFVVPEFVATFHEIFLRCKQQRVRLHPDFLPLGAYLAALYDHLEKLGVEVDVASAFASAAPNAAARETRAHG